MESQMQNKSLRISKDVTIANNAPIAVIAGPCVIESEKHTLFLAKNLKKITAELKIPFIFKASFDKANRSSYSSYRGVSIDKGLKIFAKIMKELNLSILTDIHTESQAEQAANVVDFLQIPAFLSRQTDLIKACAKTGKPVNIKKGQFLAPEDMFNVVKKCKAFGNNKISLTERGASFGYHNLVTDFRSIEIMKQTGYPVIFDATHSVQLPGKTGTASGGNREFVLPLSKAAVAVGISALFLEVHENPNKALSDGATCIDLKTFKNMLKIVELIDRTVKR